MPDSADVPPALPSRRAVRRSPRHAAVALHLFGDRLAVRRLFDVDGRDGALARVLAAEPSTRHWQVDGAQGGDPALPAAVRLLAVPAARLRLCDAVCCPDGFGATDPAVAASALRHLLESLAPDGRLLLTVPLAVDAAAPGDLAVPASSLLRLAPHASLVDDGGLVGTVVLSRRSLARLEHFAPTCDPRCDPAAARADLAATGHAADGVLYVHGDGPAPRLAARIATVEAQVDAALAAGRHDGALAAMLIGVHHHHKTPGIAHHALYYPGLDRQLERLAAQLDAECREPGDAAPPSTDNTLVVATELYRVGGHSKVLEDVVREARSPVVVLTEAFAGYREEAADHGWVHDALGGASVVVLTQTSLWSKCRALRRLTQRLRPARIVYFNHHQDPVPFVGTLGHAGSRKVFVHHADHHPSLGVTLAGMEHVDMTDEIAAVCSRELGAPPSTLPLHVVDEGRRDFAPVAAADWSVVTSGTGVKFARDGELALHSIAGAALGAMRGRFYHIGPMDADWLAQIRAQLAGAGIDPERFVAIGPVASLWRALRDLPAHVYIGSAPVGGARAAVEVQGCGFPLAHHRPVEAGSLVALESIYASPALGWSLPADLPGVLATIAGLGHARFSDAARELYERRFSRARFREVLQEIGVL